MGCGMQRNDTEIIAQAFCKEKMKYTPLAVQQIIETINKETEKYAESKLLESEE